MLDPDTLDTKEDLKLPDGELGDAVRKEYGKDENGILVSVNH